MILKLVYADLDVVDWTEKKKFSSKLWIRKNKFGSIGVIIQHTRHPVKWNDMAIGVDLGGILLF